MGALEQQLARLRAFNDLVHLNDQELSAESAGYGRPPPGLEAMDLAQPLEEALALESIVLRRTRPVLAIQNNITKLEFIDKADSEIWLGRLRSAESVLNRVIRAVGRIDIQGGRLDWVGTGWLVAENILVTNRHVAREFATQNGKGFDFRIGLDGKMSAGIDFLQEIDNPATLVFRLIKTLHIEYEPGPDLAFFEVELTSGSSALATPIGLSSQIRVTRNVATIGYPAYDSRIPEPDLMEEIFGKTYNKKRLAPGAVTAIEPTRILHNCTTLGGNSGSAVVDLETGEALGLHFSGSFLATNYAVRADVVKHFLDNLRGGKLTRPETSIRKRPATAPRGANRVAPTPRSASITIPITVTVSVADTKGLAGTLRRNSASAALVSFGDNDVVAGEEGRPEDYRDRAGYQTEFLGTGTFHVDLPSLERDYDDVLEFEFAGRKETELRYEHYSVVMSRTRRMCFFSAVNIDGGLSRKSARVGWKWDPRIPKSQQIMNECYGNPPKFSRGHMTRREDPGWGAPKTAKRGNEDSMHVTNTAPQMQAFNSPIWLALEDYALSHAKEDDMKMSVFTGPYFEDNDPEMYGVRIPQAFWKIIAFIHDETGTLCATGYEMSQEHTLHPEEEFVFGAFTSPQLNIATQVSIRSIEARSGIRFGRLAHVDPLVSDDEGIEGQSRVILGTLEQIRFLR